MGAAYFPSLQWVMSQPELWMLPKQRPRQLLQQQSLDEGAQEDLEKGHLQYHRPKLMVGLHSQSPSCLDSKRGRVSRLGSATHIGYRP